MSISCGFENRENGVNECTMGYYGKVIDSSLVGFHMKLLFLLGRTIAILSNTNSVILLICVVC